MLKRGDVCLVDLGIGVGSEQGGVRPCLVVQNDIGNQCAPTLIVCPITTKAKKFNKTHMKVQLQYESNVMFEQIRVVDKQRVIKYITTLTQNQMKVANEKIMMSLGMM